MTVLMGVVSVIKIGGEKDSGGGGNDDDDGVVMMVVVTVTVMAGGVCVPCSLFPSIRCHF